MDVRRKVVQACERGTASQAEVAQFFGASVSFVEKSLRLHRRTGALEPDRKLAGRPAQISATVCAQVQQWLEEQNDLILTELTERLQAQCGLCASISCVWLQHCHEPPLGPGAIRSAGSGCSAKNFGLNVTILGAQSCTGLDAVMTVEGATDTAVFRAYVEHVLVPTLVADDIVVMDNLSVHKVSGIR